MEVPLKYTLLMLALLLPVGTMAKSKPPVNSNCDVLLDVKVNGKESPGTNGSSTHAGGAGACEGFAVEQLNSACKTLGATVLLRARYSFENKPHNTGYRYCTGGKWK
jgi:hypothetical protein